MEDVWENGNNNDNNMWIRINELCIDTGRQSMDVTIRERAPARERGLQTQCNSFRSNRENDVYIFIGEARRGMIWLKVGF
jgi:hypothetical protein